MKETFQTTFQQFESDDSGSVIEVVWVGNNDLTDEEYKQEMMDTATLYEEHHPQALLVDIRRFQYIIAPNTQEWVNENVFPRMFKAGVRKMALLVPSELFAKVSVEQTLDEETAKDVFQTRFFDDGEKARGWLISDN